MKKIPTLLVRNPDDRAHVLDEITPGCEWVLAGAQATQKRDGTCVMLDEIGDWYARREVGKGKTPPENFVEEDFDSLTGKAQGWEPIKQSPFSKFHAEALDDLAGYEPGTYELVGPKINGNPERTERHELIRHGEPVGSVSPLTIEQVKWFVRFVGEVGWEGIVWYHPDGRMAKLKARDLVPEPVDSLPSERSE